MQPRFDAENAINHEAPQAGPLGMPSPFVAIEIVAATPSGFMVCPPSILNNLSSEQIELIQKAIAMAKKQLEPRRLSLLDRDLLEAWN